MESAILHPSQAQIASDRHRFRVVNCGRRFGKTLLSCWEMFGLAVSKETRIAYIAPTYQQARDIAWNELKRITMPVQANVNESRLEVSVKNKQGTTSLIVLRGWESIETLRGQSYDLIVLDEVSSYRNFWSNWQEVIRPTLTDRKGEGLFISTPKGFNHFYELYNLEREDVDYKSFHFTTYDNPHIPSEEIDKARQELTEDRFAQEYLADFRKTEGLVYKEFDRSRHLKEIDTNYTRKFGGVDFGFRHKAAVITILEDAYGNYFVDDEWVHTEKTDADVAQYVSALGWQEAYPDPESQSGIEEMRRRGVHVRDVVKNKDSVKNGIDIVRELFKTNRLFIHPTRCPNLIWGLETYSYADQKPGNPRADENPLKENDDEVDALRYPLMMKARRSTTNAHVYIPMSAQPRDNLNPLKDTMSAPNFGEKMEVPRYAHVHVPKL